MEKIVLRWEQRFDNFLNAFKQLEDAISLSQTRVLTPLEEQGLIQAFEFTHELSWNVLKDYIELKGGQKLIGSKDTTQEAFQKNLITNGDIWMEMIKSRNLTSHTYNKVISDGILKKILTVFFTEFLIFKAKFESLKSA